MSQPMEGALLRPPLTAPDGTTACDGAAGEGATPAGQRIARDTVGTEGGDPGARGAALVALAGLSMIAAGLLHLLLVPAHGDHALPRLLKGAAGFIMVEGEPAPAVFGPLGGGAAPTSSGGH